MTTYTYKGYNINQIGLSHYIYRPNNPAPSLESKRLNTHCNRIEGSKTAAMRWINNEIAQHWENVF